MGVDALDNKSSRSPVSEGPGVKLGLTGLPPVMGLDACGCADKDLGGPLDGGVVVAETDVSVEGWLGVILGPGGGGACLGSGLRLSFGAFLFTYRLSTRS